MGEKLHGILQLESSFLCVCAICSSTAWTIGIAAKKCLREVLLIKGIQRDEAPLCCHNQRVRSVQYTKRKRHIADYIQDQLITLTRRL